MNKTITDIINLYETQEQLNNLQLASDCLHKAISLYKLQVINNNVEENGLEMIRDKYKTLKSVADRLIGDK